jgi:hypothetical protein
VNGNLEVDISNRHLNHSIRLIRDLSDAGWAPIQYPTNASIAPNRQLVELRTPNRTVRVRVSIYKVGDRGEAHRRDERRIEITTTFASGLPRLRNWADVVLGYDSLNDAYVGLDPRRLGMGGETHNASSSVDPAALRAVPASRVLVRPHETPSLGLEYQALFRPRRLGEYFFNYELIHAGRYRGDGLLSGSSPRPTRRVLWTLPIASCREDHLILRRRDSARATSPTVSAALVEAFEIEGLSKLADRSPEELERVLQKCREVGDRAEAFVYRYERLRLQRAGRSDLADRIDWVSQKAVGRGYDIKSFDMSGERRFVEVKATIGRGRSFFMSANEWKAAGKLKDSYWIYRVVEALDRPSISVMLQDPIEAERAGQIVRAADAWIVTIL